MKNQDPRSSDLLQVKRWKRPSLLLALLLLLPGCAEQSNQGQVTGTITVNGKPAKTGAIAFFPLDGTSPTAGAVIKAGKYTALVSPGKAKVEIRVSKAVGEKKLYDTPNSPVQQILEEVLPAKYNNQSELTFDVQSGEQEKNYALTTE